MNPKSLIKGTFLDCNNTKNRSSFYESYSIKETEIIRMNKTVRTNCQPFVYRNSSSYRLVCCLEVKTTLILNLRGLVSWANLGCHGNFYDRMSRSGGGATSRAGNLNDRMDCTTARRVGLLGDLDDGMYRCARWLCGDTSVDRSGARGGTWNESHSKCSLQSM